jgi:hypothetical protein
VKHKSTKPFSTGIEENNIKKYTYGVISDDFDFYFEFVRKNNKPIAEIKVPKIISKKPNYQVKRLLIDIIFYPGMLLKRKK